MVITTLGGQNGLTDQELADRLKAYVPSVHPVTLVCSQLEHEGVIKRIKRIGKPSANYLAVDRTPAPALDMSDDVPLPAVPMATHSEHLAELSKLGFVRCGEWYLLRDLPNFTLDQLGERSNVLFTFVIDGTVLYMNRSRRSLAHGLNQLLNPQDNWSNQKTRGFIHELLRRGKTIEIYGLEDPGSIQFAGYKISLTAGLEPALLDFFRPTWNQNREAA